MGVLGGFRNMLKTWKNNLIKFKKKKQKEKEEEKKKKQNKKVSIFYTVLAIIIYPFAVVFKKDSKNITVTLEKKINECKKVEEINDIKIEFEQIKKKVDVVKQKIIKEKINNKELELEKNFKLKPNDLSITPNISNNKKSTKQKNEKFKKKKIKAGIEEKQEAQKTNKIINIITIFNEKLKKEFDIEIKKVEEKTDLIEKYNDSYQITYIINEIKEKIDFLKQEYKNNNLKFYNNLSFESIEELEKQILLLEENLEIKKKEFLKTKEIEKTEKNKEKEEKNKKEKLDKQEIKKETNEFELCSKVVIENINKCNIYYNTYLKELTKHNNKNTLFRHMNVLSNSVLNFMLGIIPFRFIRNRFIRNYVLAINTNNTIRIMNRMVNPLSSNNHYVLLNEYKNMAEVMQNTYEVMYDSLDRIKKIKDDLINLNVYDIDQELYNKVLSMESLINKNIEQIEKNNKKINKIYTKIKNN